MRKWRVRLRAILAILPAISIFLSGQDAAFAATIGSVSKGWSPATITAWSTGGTQGTVTLNNATLALTATDGTGNVSFGFSQTGCSGFCTYAIQVFCGTVATSNMVASGSGQLFNGTPTASWAANAKCNTVSDITVELWGRRSDGTFGGFNISNAGTSPDSVVNGVVASLCTSGTYSVSGSYSGTTFAVRAIIPANGTFPAGGFRVDAPDPGSDPTGTATMTIASTDTVDGYANTYYHSITLSTLSTLTARVSAKSSTGNTICYLSITLATNGVSSTPPPDTSGSGSGDTGDANGGSSCGFSLNPIHYLICLFEPSTSQLQGWSGKISDIESKPPVNIFTAGVAYVYDGANAIVCSVNNSCGPGGPQNGQYPDAFQAPTPCGNSLCGDSSNKVDLLAAAGNDVSSTTWGQVYYHICEVGIWGVFLLVAYRTIGAAVGGK